jgi:uncharacterized protein (TIGR00725 family)
MAVTHSPRPYRIAVVGSADASSEEYELARRVGAELARAGAVVVCGGRGGVMEAVARGATESGGLAIGILPGGDGEQANPWVSVPIATGLGEARNALVVRASEAVIAIAGSWGTLSEIALARKMGLATTTLGDPPAAGLGMHSSAGAVEAARWAVERAAAHRESRTHEGRAGGSGP